MTKHVRRLIGSLAESPQVRDAAMLCALKCVNCQQRKDGATYHPLGRLSAEAPKGIIPTARRRFEMRKLPAREAWGAMAPP